MNKFFVYEGKNIIAAQPTFNGAMRYFKNGCKLLNGSPEHHKNDCTKIANKIKVYADNKR
jgi:hypothetical protein